jgi:hypothetical protein
MPADNDKAIPHGIIVPEGFTRNLDDIYRFTVGHFRGWYIQQGEAGTFQSN